jgi:hypothetical protein
MMSMAESSAGPSGLIRPGVMSALKRKPLDDTPAQPDERPRPQKTFKSTDPLQDNLEVQAAPEDLPASTGAEPKPGAKYSHH